MVDVLNRRALLTKSVLVAGALGAGAGFDAAEDSAKAARSLSSAILLNNPKHSSSEGTRSFRSACLNVTIRAVRGAAFPSFSPDGIPARAMTLSTRRNSDWITSYRLRVIQRTTARVSYPVLARPGAEPSNRGGGFAERRATRIEEAGDRGRRKRDIRPFGSVASVEAPSCNPL